MWIKIPYTLFIGVLVPVYWVERGLANFLWGSDIALLITLVALWVESRFLASMMAVAILLPELAWNLDFFSRLIVGSDVVGLDATGYMFTEEKSLFVRGLSLFHVFLPVLLVWLVYRLGYERRALIAQTLLAWIVFPVSYLFTDPGQNINWVFGLGSQPQTWMPAPLYVLFLMALFPLLVYVPTHLVLKSIFAKGM